jgi:peptide subunit release factor 1 (eRF1)
MQRNDVTPQRLRRLAELRADGCTVLSLYLDLDPREFATFPARASAIRSLLDEAMREIRDRELGHAEQRALRASAQRAEAYFRDAFSAEGAHGLALFASEPDDLFEVVRLPRSAGTRVCISTRPLIEPLTRVDDREGWAVVLASRADGRVLRGSAQRLAEVAVLDEDVHGQHQQGGWSQPRYERSVDREAAQHVERVLATLLRSDAENRFDRLLIGAPDEVFGFVERHLPPDVRDRFAGRLAGLDVAVSTPDDVLAAATPIMREDARRRERQLLDRLSDALGERGRASASLSEVLDALVQRRVEALLVDDGFSAPGAACPACGWLGPSGERCPVDGTALEQVGDITEQAVEAALTQSAEVVFVRQHEDLGAYGGIAALQRF